MKTTISRSLAVLSLALFPLALLAAAAPVVTDSPAVVAHLGITEGEDARTHVHVELNRTDVTDIAVELFDADGKSIHTYAMKPQEGGVYRPIITIDVAPVLAPRVATARVTAFTISNGKAEALFDTGMIPTQVNPCANQCDYTRLDCHHDCWLANCISATYSCTGTLGNCVHNCTCQECPTR